MMDYDKAFDEAVKQGVYQAMKECELTIGMTLKEAVEKQIRQKVQRIKVEDVPVKVCNGTFTKGTTVYKCPCCNTFLTLTHEFCYKCGQAIDWSENDGMDKRKG